MIFFKKDRSFLLQWIICLHYFFLTNTFKRY